MAQYLVIVESPAKAKTINKYLGKSYQVLASNGHLRDLPKSQMGIDIQNDYEPRYITIRGKGALLNSLKQKAKVADKIFLATDPDREGEAISWHLAAALGVPESKTRRITFNEITKTAVTDAIKHPRDIDFNLVDAQQARRVMDRIVGYSISPILWKKVKKGLSAGRVQSVATRLVVERDREINAFIPQEYWNIYANLKKNNGKQSFTATFYGAKNGDKIELPNEDIVNGILKNIDGKKFVVESVKLGTREKKAPPPFITSSLQQDAANKLNFTAKRTMSLAQQLYEGSVSIPGHGAVGLITYMRTDSFHVSTEANSSARSYINSQFGSDYLPKTPTIYKSKKGAQDAHEAIRPTYIELTPESLKSVLDAPMYKLYKLIWERFVASCMVPARYDTISSEISAGDYLFRASGTKLNFAGYTKIYADKLKDEEETMPNVEKGEVLTPSSITPKQSFTQPPAHFTEASLIHYLEDAGIGRPSTYAPTISTILARGYCVRDGKSLFSTELGEIVTDILKDNFPDIVDAKFTAHMEDQLDNVEDGAVQWKSIIREFYPTFEKSLEKAAATIDKIKIKDEESDVICDKCGRNMVFKMSKFGKFLACPGFPECRNTKTIIIESGVNCPKCSGRILVKKSKRGKIYYGCENNPTCDLMLWDKPVDKKCDKCDSIMMETKGRDGKTVCSNSECVNGIKSGRRPASKSTTNTSKRAAKPVSKSATKKGKKS